jgi:hypothetical protein
MLLTEPAASLLISTPMKPQPPVTRLLQGWLLQHHAGVGGHDEQGSSGHGSGAGQLNLAQTCD